MATKEIKSLTGLRGVAAIWVILFHIFLRNKYTYLDNYIISNSYVKYFIFKIISKGYLAVDLFFLLSAYVLTLSYSNQFREHVSWIDYKKYLLKRLIRVYPLYFIITVSFYLFNNIHGLGKIGLLTNLTFLQIINYKLLLNGVTWSLCTEFLVYLIFPYLIYNLKNKTIFLILGFSILSILLITYSSNIKMPLWFDGYTTDLYKKDSLELYIGFPGILRTIGDYLIGISLFYYRSKIKVDIKLLITLILISLLIPKGYSDSLSIIFLGIFVIQLSKNDNNIFSTKVPYFLGLISYSIYINQYFFIHNGIWLDHLYLRIPLLIIFSIASYYLIEKPASKYLKKLLLK